MAKSDAVSPAATVPDLSGVSNINDALVALAGAGIVVEDISGYGDGFILLPTDEKASLVGVAFAIADGRKVTDKATERVYWSLRIITGDGRKLIVNDGSVGIAKQVEQIVARRGTVAGLVCPNGLSGGEYTTTLPSGEKVKASTFYLAGV
jgi:hypothetical protein